MEYEITIRADDTKFVPKSGWDEFAPPPSPVWADFNEPPWRISMRFVEKAGVPTLGELHIYPIDEAATEGEWSDDPSLVPDGGLPPTLLRKFPLGRSRDTAVMQLTDPGHPAWDDGWPDPYDNWYDVAGQAGFTSRPRGRGRTPLTERQLALVALAYVDAVNMGRTIAAHVVERLEAAGETVTYTTATSRIVKARQRGFLEDAPSGHRGGGLTDKAKQVLGIGPPRAKEDLL